MKHVLVMKHMSLSLLSTVHILFAPKLVRTAIVLT